MTRLNGIRLLRALRDAFAVQRSGLLQALHYRSQFEQGLGMDRVILRLWPALHYTLVGADRNKNPNAFFDTETYRQTQLAESSRANPLAHYLRVGAGRRLPAGPRFDTGFYLDQHPELDPSKENPLRHFLDRAPTERTAPTPLDASLAPLEAPRPASASEGRRWLHDGLGPGTPGPTAPATAARPDQRPFIGFDWDKGGWNNIRMQIEVMAGLAAMFDRSLVLPEPSAWYLIPGPRTHLFDFYDESSFRAQVPTRDGTVDGSIDDADLWRVPSHLSLLQTTRIARSDLRAHAERRGWFFPRSTRMFGCLASVFASDPEIYRLVHRALRIRPDVLDVACSLLESRDLEPGDYLAAHVRRGDFAYARMRHLGIEAIIEALRREGADQAGKVLIVSDENDPQLLDACRRAGWDTVCWSETSPVEPKLEGIVDMLCCCLAWRFVGTPLSTFSSGIMQWRGYVSRVASAHVDATPRFTIEVDPMPWWATVDPHAWLVV